MINMADCESSCTSSCNVSCSGECKTVCGKSCSDTSSINSKKKNRTNINWTMSKKISGTSVMSTQKINNMNQR